jgi:arylsulfatase A
MLRHVRCAAWLLWSVVGFAVGSIHLASTECAFSQETKNNSAAAEPLPNLIFVFCDNLGYGDIEPFGGKLHDTPNLNRMASEGRKFTHFYSTSGVCTPSRASLMTGCYSQRVGMHTNPRDGQVLRPISPHGLNPNETTVAEVLKGAGYATSIIGKWHLGDQTPFLPTRQGFDEFWGVPYSDDMTHAVGQRLGERFEGKRWPPLPLMRNEEVVEAPVDRNGLTKRYTELALDFIEANQQNPFFLYMPQAMPGSTSEPFASPAFRGKSKNGPWGDSIEELDWSIGRILDKLVELKIERRTLVIWTSDNGAPLARDAASPARGSNQPLFGRGYTTSEGGFRIPMIAWWPGKVPSGSVCSELATTMDVLPTMASLTGQASPKLPIDGHDIAPLLFNEPDAKTPYEAFFYYQTTQLQAVRSGPWKLFPPLKPLGRHPHFGNKASEQPLLFNVVEDVGSQVNVAEKHPDVVARLTALADRGRKEHGDAEQRGSGQREYGTVPNPVPPTLPETATAADGSQASIPLELKTSKEFAAAEAHQAATADGEFVYAISSQAIAKYDRKTGFRIATSTGKAQHLNSGYAWKGKILCAHSNYPNMPERSEIKQLDPVSMRLTDFHNFGDFGGSLTWVVRDSQGWLCNFAKYGSDNAKTFLVRFDDDWQELQRWTYPPEVVAKWGTYSTSGGIWRQQRLWITDHDHGRVDILRIPSDDGVLVSVSDGEVTVPFTGQGIAEDPLSGGLIGISRARRKIIIAVPPTKLLDGVPVRSVPRADQLRLPNSQLRAATVQDYAARRWQTLQDMQLVMGDFPGELKRCDLRMEVMEETDCETYTRQLIRYQSEPGGWVTAYLLIPKNLRGPAPAVLCLHPTDNQIGHKVVVGLGGRANRQYASELAERGFVTLSPSYPQLAEYQPDLVALGWESGTMKAIWDNVRGLDLLDSLPSVRHGVYGAIGHSLGGHNAVYTAVFDDRLSVVVSSCGLDAYPDYYGGDASRWLPGQGWTQNRYIPKLTKYHDRLNEIPFDFHEMISAIAPRDVFIAAPLHDGNFRAESVDRVVAAARPVFELFAAATSLQVEHPDCDHDFPNEMREKAYRLFEEKLR